MIRSKLYCSVALVGALALSFAGSVTAQPVDQRTYFTFSGPFEVPGGKTLPAGKYTFRILDSPSNRHIVQVLSQDGKQVHATVMAIPAQRQDPPSDPEIRFMEAPANTPPAIRTWWYPGRTIGHEFIYPKSQARRLAERQSEPVLTVKGNESTAEEMENADLARLSKGGEETSVTAEATARQAETTPRQAEAAPRQTPPPPAADRTTEPRPTTKTADTTRRTSRTELSRTASPLPLIGLAGVLALALAAALQLRRA
jgi:hypothetical protein